ncbi:MAG TPA: hypothetical protein VLF60_04855 [Candidatus Saccharimonadales bacterium]|nr:hypothetical protein [Candidatus Saccharimonadales bacterium]
MSIDPTYQPMYQQVRDLQFAFRDATGGSDHPAARQIDQEMDHLMDDMEVKKNPRDLENRIKNIQHYMADATHQGEALMNYNHQDHFTRSFEQMRRDVQHFSDYS